jgi:hypothetical protein
MLLPAVAFSLISALSALSAAERPDPTTVGPWDPFLGCWSAGERPLPESATLTCLVPVDGEPLAADVLVLSNGKKAESSRIRVDVAWTASAGERCLASETVRFSLEGDRVLVQGEVACAGAPVEYRTISAGSLEQLPDELRTALQGGGIKMRVKARQSVSTTASIGSEADSSCAAEIDRLARIHERVPGQRPFPRLHILGAWCSGRANLNTIMAAYAAYGGASLDWQQVAPAPVAPSGRGAPAPTAEPPAPQGTAPVRAPERAPAESPAPVREAPPAPAPTPSPVRQPPAH